MDPRKGKKIARGKRQNTLAAGSTAYGLDDAFELFYSAKKAEGMRPRTLSDYVTHWKYFREWFDEKFPDITEIGAVTPSVIREYVNHMSTRPKYAGVENREQAIPLSPYTITIRLRSLKTMFNFLEREKIVVKSPVANVKLPRHDTEDKQTFTEDQFARLLAAPDTETFAGFRDRTLMLVLADGGFRIHEALQLTTEFIDIKARCVNLPGWMNKNRKPRVVPLSAGVIREIMALINENRQTFGEAEHIFLSNYGEPLKANQVRHRLRMHAKNAGLHGVVQVSPHQFRSFFLTQFMLNGGDIFSAQRIAAHSSISTTRRYVKLNDEDIRNQHANYSPIARIGLSRAGKRRK